MHYTCGATVVHVDFVCEVARRAGAEIMRIYNTDVQNWDVRLKEDSSPLTKADLAANNIICSELQAKYPLIPIISEENAMVDYSIRQTYTHYFVVDPLDGTKEFIKRNGQFTVNIGLCEGNAPVMGVVFIPAAEIPKMYFSVKGYGSYVEDEAERYPIKIRCKEFSEDDENLHIVASASHNTPETESFIDRFKNPTLKNMGSSIKLLLVAEGSAHIYPRMAPTSEWDTCAAHSIVLEAGGEVLQAAGGAPATEGLPVVYNKEHTLNPFFVVYGKRKAAPKNTANQGPKPPPAENKLSILLITLTVLVLAVAIGVVLLGNRK